MLQSPPKAGLARPIGLALLILSCLLALALPASRADKIDAAAAGPERQPLLPAQIRYGREGLPSAVLDLRDAMEAAIDTGRIEDLLAAYELSAVPPDLGVAPKTDPVAHWKKVSGDGNGREVLAALSLILDAGYAVTRRGADIENNKVYVWPYFAEIPLDKLTPRQEVELLRLVPADVARRMQKNGRYTHWRLAIGADGTWHELRKAE